MCIFVKVSSLLSSGESVIDLHSPFFFFQIYIERPRLSLIISQTYLIPRIRWFVSL